MKEQSFLSSGRFVSALQPQTCNMQKAAQKEDKL